MQELRTSFVSVMGMGNVNALEADLEPTDHVLGRCDRLAVLSQFVGCMFHVGVPE